MDFLSFSVKVHSSASASPSSLQSTPSPAMNRPSPKGSPRTHSPISPVSCDMNVFFYKESTIRVLQTLYGFDKWNICIRDLLLYEWTIVL